MMGYYGGWGMMWWFGELCLLLVVVGLVLFGLMLTRNAQPVAHGASADTATDVLRRRYAAGELSREEFAQLR